jgi:hypothetical protein
MQPTPLLEPPPRLAKSREQIVPIEFARDTAAILWPCFVEQDGMILVDLSGRDRPSKRRITRRPDIGFDNTGIEAFHNHTHILDLFKHDPKVWRARLGHHDRRHPHFRLAERIGVAIAEAWFAKLRQDFPDDHFRVYYTRDDDPIVRFHRVYPNEPPWLEDQEPPRSIERIRVWDTRRIG